MITAWLTYCLLVSALVGAAAWVAEWASRSQGWPGRWPWAVAMAGSMGLPLAAWLRPATSPELASTSMLPMPGAYVMESIPALSLQAPTATGPAPETVVLWAWATATAGLLLYLAVSALRVRAERRRWRRGEVDGVEVMVSEATGPAALGLFRGLVVLPEWALALDERLRRLLVLHEAEHVRARDPQLAVAGLVACTLMPWNVALWWQLARLRGAIEMDCDARVLRRSGDAASYGSLLLEVGQRRARLAVGLAESRSMLERRIRMITRTTTGRRTFRALGLGAVSALVLAVACETPPPTGLADEASRPLATEQALAEAVSLRGQVAVIVDGEELAGGREGLATLRPEDIEHIDVIHASAGGEQPGTSVILVLTKDASPEMVERMRRIRETLLAERAAGRTRPAEDVAAEPTFTPMTVAPRLRNTREVQQALQRHYPPLLRDAGIGGAASIWFFIDEEGAVRDTRINRSSGYEALDQAALAVADVMEFSPAYNRDVRTPVWVALEILFETGDPEADAALLEQTRRRADAIRERTTPEPAGRPVDRDMAAEPTFTPMTDAPRLTNAADVREVLQRHYPPLLRQAGIGGTARVWFFIDGTGTVRDTRLDRTSGYDALDEAALRVAPAMEFSPGRNRGEPVPVWISLEITFEVP